MAFLEKVHKAWERWRPLPAYIENRLRETNDPERLRKILAEKGFLLCFCHNCATAATLASARNILEVGQEPLPKVNLKPCGKFDAKGRLSIPRWIREEIGITKGTLVEMDVYGEEKDKILLTVLRK